MNKLPVRLSWGLRRCAAIKAEHDALLPAKRKLAEPTSASNYREKIEAALSLSDAGVL